MVKPDAFQHLGKIINAIYNSGFIISKLKVCKLSKEEAEHFYAVHKGTPCAHTLAQITQTRLHSHAHARTFVMQPTACSQGNLQRSHADGCVQPQSDRGKF